MSTELEDYLRMIGLSTDMLLKPSSSTTADGGGSSPRRASPTQVAGPADDITNTADDVMSPRENEASSHSPPQPARPSTDAGVVGQRRQSSSVLGVPPPASEVFRPRRAAVDEDDEVSSVMTYIVTSTVADFDPESRRSPTPPPLPPPLRPESIRWDPEAEERSSPVALLDTSTPQQQQQIQSTHHRPSSVISVGTVSQKSMYGNLQNGRRVFPAGVVDRNNVGSVAAVQSPPSTHQFNGYSTITRVPSSSVLGGSQASAVNVTTSTVNRVAPLPPPSPRLPSSSQEQTSSTNVRLPTDPSVMSTLTRRSNAVSSQFGTLTHTGPVKSASTSSVVVGNGTVPRRAPTQTDAISVTVSPAAAAAGTSSVPIPRVDAAEPAPHYTTCKIVLGAYDDDVQTTASRVDAYELATNQPGRNPPVVPAAAATTTQPYTSTIIRCSSSSATKVFTKTNLNHSPTMAAAAASTVHPVTQLLPATRRVDDPAFQLHQNNSSSTGTAPIPATLAATEPKSTNPIQSHVAVPNYVSVIRIGSSSSVGSAAEEVGTSPSWSRRSAAEPVVFKTVPVAAHQSALVQSQPSTPLGSRECVSTRLHSDDVAADRSSPCDGSVVGSLQGPVKSSLKKSPKTAAVPTPRHVKTKSVSFSTGSIEDCNDQVTSSTEEVDGGGGSWMQCGVRAIQANHNGGVDDFGRGRTLPPVLVNGKSIHQLPSNASPLGSRAAQSTEGLHQQQQQKQQQRTVSLWNGGMRTLPAGRTRVVVTTDTFHTGQLLQSDASKQPFAAVGRDVDPAMSATLPPSRRSPPGHIPISNNVDDSRQTSSEPDDRRFRSFSTAETSASSDRSLVGFDVMTERLTVPRSAFSGAATSTMAASAVVSRTGSGRAIASVAPRPASTHQQNNNNNNNNNNSVDYRRRVLSIGENPGETTEDCITDAKHSNGGGEKSSPRRAPLEGNNNRTPALSVDDRSSPALTCNEMTNQKTQIKKTARNLPRNTNKQCKVQ